RWPARARAAYRPVLPAPYAHRHTTKTGRLATGNRRNLWYRRDNGAVYYQQPQRPPGISQAAGGGCVGLITNACLKMIILLPQNMKGYGPQVFPEGNSIFAGI